MKSQIVYFLRNSNIDLYKYSNSWDNDNIFII